VKFTFGGDSAEVDCLIIAAGRGPTSRASASIRRASRSTSRAVKVDGALKTSKEGVYAIGDLVAGPALAHKASDEGSSPSRTRRLQTTDRVHRHPARHVLHAQRRLVRADRRRRPGGRPSTSPSARSSTAPSAAARCTATAPAWSRSSATSATASCSAATSCGSKATELIQELVNAKASRAATRGRAHHPRPPHAVRGDHGSRPGRGRVVDPRLALPRKRVRWPHGGCERRAVRVRSCARDAPNRAGPRWSPLNPSKALRICS
jgi:hypothetical protein